MRPIAYALALSVVASLSAAASLSVAPARAADITGAGATFPFPVYAKWAEAYRKETGNGLNYQSIGSGGGIKQIQAGTVDFGATDAPLKGADLEKSGLIQFPTVMGGVVAVVNMPSAKGLKLTGAVLADIFAGKIAKWNDPKIAGLNEGMTLPSAAITPVYRSDASGTTNIFTTYLSDVSPEWKASLGANTAISWPAGQGGKGNEGVAATVKQVPNSIGYVEYAYAKQIGLPVVLVANKAGKYPAPGDASFRAAAANADWSAAPGFGIGLTNQAGDEAWPITAVTFILIHKAPANPERTAEALKFFDWAYKNGGKLASDLDYVALPDAVAGKVRDAWKDVKDKSGKPLHAM